MELPARVLVHNETIGVKGAPGALLNVSDNGFFEVNLKFGDRIHRVLLPISTTVIIQEEPEEQGVENLEIER